MALEKYRQKRNFKSTPEPAGDPNRRRRAGQEGRQGSVLLRAEAPREPPALRFPARAQRRPALVGGAQGTSLDPKTKRLAMHVEDHPFEYGTFEGVIPEGYGAGIVMLWDQGTWTPEADDVDAALRRAI